jgi:diacylglycerol kinase
MLMIFLISLSSRRCGSMFREFLTMCLWVVGSLIGTTLDVDLVTLLSHGVVRIFVGMLNSKALEKIVDAAGPCVEWHMWSC